MKASDIPKLELFRILSVPGLGNTVRLEGRVHRDINAVFEKWGVPRQVTTARINKLLRVGFLERKGHKLWLTTKALTEFKVCQVL